MKRVLGIIVCAFILTAPASAGKKTIDVIERTCPDVSTLSVNGPPQWNATRPEILDEMRTAGGRTSLLCIYTTRKHSSLQLRLEYKCPDGYRAEVITPARNGEGRCIGPEW